MSTFYLVLIIILFVLAISDLVVGVSNDAVNFLNSAVGAKATHFKWIMLVAALGILAGATFSSGMMEVARKGIFHPELFYFHEIILIFLAVMITDVILLDTFNTFGMPTSTTVSIVFELLGAAVAISLIKVLTNPDSLALYEYINSAKALAIISGILLSVVVAFTAGVIIQYLSRLLFSFEYEKKVKYFGAIWGGIGIAAITYFILIKGSKGASFMDADLKATIKDNTWLILGAGFVVWTILLQVLHSIFKVDILKVLVLFGTFALAMAFAGNDLVNFIGVPLAGYNSYQLFVEAGGTGADTMLMDGLAGKVPTPTLLLLLAGVIMAVTLYTSKKARSVVKTSLDLGRQDEGYERFSSFLLSRRIVRSFANFANGVNNMLPGKVRNHVSTQFDQRPFTRRQMHKGHDAPAFDMIRASVTLVVASVLIAIGTNLKLPLSTTYVTFMVFMGTSLADGAWGRESAVYRVSGVLSVIGGWFFTAFSAFTVAFIFAIIFYYGGMIAIIAMCLVAAYLVYRAHRYHDKRVEEQEAVEKSIIEGTLSKAKVLDLASNSMSKTFGQFSSILDKKIDGLAGEDLGLLNLAFKEIKSTEKETYALKGAANRALDKIPEHELEAGHFYILVVDYLHEISENLFDIVKSSLSHVDNNHKPLMPEQIEDLRGIDETLKSYYAFINDLMSDVKDIDEKELENINGAFIKSLRSARKKQIKRIKGHTVGTRNSVLFLNQLSDYRNIGLYAQRLINVYKTLIQNPID